MSEHVYKTIEVTGSSPRDLEDAIRRAVSKAAETVRHVDWFETVSIRGYVRDGNVDHFQVTLKIGFRLE
jgi:flavin-binding protein dodecin